MPAPEHLRRCPCGRLCASRSGLATHLRACRVARAASAAFSRSIELGLSRAQLDAARDRAIRLARSSSDQAPERLGDACAEAIHRALQAAR